MEGLDGAVDRLHRLGLDVPRDRADGRDDPAAAGRGRALHRGRADPAADPRVPARRLACWRPTRAELLSAGFVGLMLPGANAVISRRREDRPVRPGRAAGRLDPAVGDPAAPRERRADRVALDRRRARRLRRPRAARCTRRATRRSAACWPASARRSCGRSARSPPRASRSRATRSSRPPGSRCSAASPSFAVGLVGGELRRRPLRRVLRPLDLRPVLPDHLRLAAGVHVLRLAAPERADLEGLHLRVREPGRRDRPRLADPRRGRSPPRP